MSSPAPDSEEGTHTPFLRHVPQGASDGSPLLILLHGRGSDESDLQGLAPFLPADAVLVTPRAPFPAAQWGYGPGWAWYRYAGGDRVEDETLADSLRALDEFLDRVEAELPIRPGARFLGGFSQGGTTALAWGLTRPDRLAGVAVFSGFLAASPLVPVSPESARGLPVFWGHGRADPNIPFALGEAGRARLREAGAALTTVDHPGGHTITGDELRELKRWIEEVRGASG